VPSLIQLCRTTTKPSVLIPAMRIVGNISIGNELHTEEILKGGGLELICHLLKSDKKSIRREACWITSNICAGTVSQIRQVLFNTELVLQVGSMFWADEIDIRKEICYIFRNMGHSGDKRAILDLYSKLNAIEGVVSLIRQDQDSQAIEVGLKCLFEMLNVDLCEGG
jgi:importin subunit alpha-6/7